MNYQKPGAEVMDLDHRGDNYMKLYEVDCGDGSSFLTKLPIRCKHVELEPITLDDMIRYLNQPLVSKNIFLRGTRMAEIIQDSYKPDMSTHDLQFEVLSKIIEFLVYETETIRYGFTEL